jgi:hypothetical protein
MSKGSIFFNVSPEGKESLGRKRDPRAGHLVLERSTPHSSGLRWGIERGDFKQPE